MPFFDPIRIGASGSVAADFTVDRSVRYNRPDNHYFSKQPSSAGNRRTFTISVWIKKFNIDANAALFYAGTSVGANHDDTDSFIFNGSNQLNFVGEESQTVKYDLVTNRQFRDPSAWYHIVLAVDTTQSTSSNRIKLYVNGVQETSFATETYPSQNYQLFVNSTVSGGYTSGNIHVLGYTGAGRGIDGYLAEYHLIDGQQLTPSSFAETNSSTGQWVPIDTSGLTYGTNGFRFQFLDNSGTTASTLGKDTSGNSNNYTPNNFSVSAGAGNDSSEDTPTNNFATINGVFKIDGFNGTRTLKEGGLAISGSTNDSSGDFMQAASIPFPLTGKWYVEANVTTLGTSGGNEGGPFIGIMDIPYIHSDPQAKIVRTDGKVATTGNAGGAGNSQFTSSFAGSISQGDVWQLAYDADNRYVYFGKNNSWANGSGSYNQSNFSNAQAYATQPTAGVQQVYIFTSPYSAVSMSFQFDFNFGQRAFAHTPPTGYEQLKSANLPDPTILLPTNHFNTVIYTGNGGTIDQDFGFNVDWVWYKNRGRDNTFHYLFDTVRGANKALYTNADDIENSQASSFYTQSFITDGSRIVRTNGDHLNESGDTYVAWGWNAGDTDGKTYTVTVVSDSGNKYRFDGYGTSAVTLRLAEGGTYIFNYPSAHPFRFSTTSDGTHGGGSEYTTGVTVLSSTSIQIVVAASTPFLYYYCSNHSGMGGGINTDSSAGSSNFDGTIQTTVKVDQTIGFSIVSYTGNGSTSASIGHGLGVAPDFIIIKNRDTDNTDWMVMHSSNPSYDGGNYKHQPLKLNSTSDLFTTILGLWATPNSSNQSVSDGQTGATARTFTNTNNDKYIAYCFSEVAGFSKFGTYIGNGLADGTFVFCGFRPAWLLTKKTSANGSWILWDNKRNPRNVCGIDINPNRNSKEDTFSNHDVDFLSNGFKLRSSDSTTNDNADTYVFIAFAESPFKNARAR